MSEEPEPIVSENAESSPVSPDRPAEFPKQSLKLYFDEKLHAHLSAALAACAEELPEDPVKFVGNYLLKISDCAMDRDPLDDFPDLLFSSKRGSSEPGELLKSNSIFSVAPIVGQPANSFDVRIRLSGKTVNARDAQTDMSSQKELAHSEDVHDKNDNDDDDDAENIEDDYEEDNGDDNEADDDEKEDSDEGSEDADHSSHDDEKGRESEGALMRAGFARTVGSGSAIVLSSEWDNPPTPDEETRRSPTPLAPSPPPVVLTAAALPPLAVLTATSQSPVVLTAAVSPTVVLTATSQSPVILTAAAPPPVVLTATSQSPVVLTAAPRDVIDTTSFADFDRRLAELRERLAPGDIQRNPDLMNSYFHRLQTVEEPLPIEVHRPMKFGSSTPFVTSRQVRLSAPQPVVDVVSDRSTLPTTNDAVSGSGVLSNEVKELRETLYESRRLIESLEVALQKERKRERPMEGICRCDKPPLFRYVGQDLLHNRLDSAQRRQLWIQTKSETIDKGTTPRELQASVAEATRRAVELSSRLEALRTDEHSQCMNDCHTVHGCSSCGSDWTRKLAHVQRKQWEAYRRQALT